MAIKKSGIINRTEKIFQEIDNEKIEKEKLEASRLQNLPKRTTTVSCRILKSEKVRIEKLVNQKGLTLAQALKKGLYDMIDKL